MLQPRWVRLICITSTPPSSSGKCASLAAAASLLLTSSCHAITAVGAAAGAAAPAPPSRAPAAWPSKASQAAPALNALLLPQPPQPPQPQPAAAAAATAGWARRLRPAAGTPITTLTHNVGQQPSLLEYMAQAPMPPLLLRHYQRGAVADALHIGSPCPPACSRGLLDWSLPRGARMYTSGNTDGMKAVFADEELLGVSWDDWGGEWAEGIEAVEERVGKGVVVQGADAVGGEQVGKGVMANSVDVVMGERVGGGGVSEGEAVVGRQVMKGAKAPNRKLEAQPKAKGTAASNQRQLLVSWTQEGRVQRRRLGMKAAVVSEAMFQMAGSEVPVPRPQWDAVLRYVSKRGLPLMSGCSATMLARVASAVARMHGPGEASGDALKVLRVIDRCAVALSMDSGFTHQNCSMLAYNFARLGFARALWFGHLAAVSGERDWAGIAPQSIANLVYAYALVAPQIGETHDPPGAQGRAKAGVQGQRRVEAHGGPKGEAQVHALVEDMLVAAVPQLQLFTPQNISNVVWALARLAQPLGSQQLLRRMGTALVGAELAGATDVLEVLLERGVLLHGGAFGAQNASMVLWACSRLRQQSGGEVRVRPAHVASLVRMLQSDILAAGPQALSVAIQALVALGVPPSHVDCELLVRSLINKVGPVGKRGSDQAVASVIYACAKGGYELRPHVMHSLVGAMSLMASYVPHWTRPLAVANAVWGAVSTGHEMGSEDVNVFSRFFMDNLQRSRPPEVARYLLSIARSRQGRAKPPYRQLQLASVTLLGRLPGFVTDNAHLMTPQLVSNLALAVATLKFHVPGLLPMLIACSKDWLQDLKPQELSNFLWSLAVLEPFESFRFFRQVEPLVAEKLPGCSAQNVCNIAWAFSVVLGRKVALECAVGLFERASAPEVRETLFDEGKRQLFPLLVLLPGLQGALQGRPELLQLADECRAARMASLATALTSKAQLELFNVLKGRGGVDAVLRQEKLLGGSLVCVHVALGQLPGAGESVAADAVPGAAESVAVDVVAPGKYTSSLPRRELGGVGLRRALLQASGFSRVVSVPVHLWNELRGQELERYIRQKLRL